MPEEIDNNPNPADIQNNLEETIPPEILELIPEDNQEKVIQILSHSQTMISHSFFPPPAELAKYNDCFDNGAKER